MASLLAVLCVAGCGSIDNRAGVMRLPKDALVSRQAGVALFSVGAPGHCVAMATFVAIVDSATGRHPKHPPIGVDAYVHKSDFAGHHGLVNAVSLPAGKYYMRPSTANPYVSSTQIPTFHFEVLAGETVYLGELFMTQSCSTTGFFRINDRYDRDLQIALAKNPALGERPVIPRLMQLGEPILRQ